LSQNLALVVNTLNADEGLPQSMRAYDIEFKVFEQFAAGLDLLSSEVELLM
jgi:hypothetical protein